MSYRSTYHRITRGANPDTHKFLGRLAKAKTAPKGRTTSAKRLGPAGVSGLARPLATPKATGRKAAPRNSPRTRKVAKGSNAAKARNLMSQLGHNPQPTRPAFKGGLTSRITRRARHAAATIGRRVGHFTRRLGL